MIIIREMRLRMWKRAALTWFQLNRQCLDTASGVGRSTDECTSMNSFRVIFEWPNEETPVDKDVARRMWVQETIAHMHDRECLTSVPMAEPVSAIDPWYCRSFEAKQCRATVSRERHNPIGRLHCCSRVSAYRPSSA